MQKKAGKKHHIGTLLICMFVVKIKTIYVKKEPESNYSVKHRHLVQDHIERELYVKKCMG